jgi:hypothetical protein
MRLLIVLLACCLTSICTAATAVEATKIDREMQLRTTLRQQIESAWRAGDFKTLETMGEGFVQHRTKTFNGMPELAPYFYDINALLYIDWPNEWNLAELAQSDCHCKAPDPSHFEEADRRWDILHKKLDAWYLRYPDSTILPVVRIKYLIRRAWFYRGGAWADKVNPKAWPRFEQYMTEADKVVRSSTSIRFKNPAWYGDAVQVAVADDWPVEEINRLYAEMPEHAQLYTVSFENAAQFMQPKWRGSHDAFLDMVSKAVRHAPEKDGLEFYARLYWVLLESDDKTLRIQSVEDVDRGMLEAGFDIVFKRYPESWNFIGAAKTACKIGDAALFERATRRLGTFDRYQGVPLTSIDCWNTDFSPTKPATAH